MNFRNFKAKTIISKSKIISFQLNLYKKICPVKKNNIKDILYFYSLTLY